MFVSLTALARKGIHWVTIDFAQIYGPWSTSVGGCREQYDLLFVPSVSDVKDRIRVGGLLHLG